MLALFTGLQLSDLEFTVPFSKPYVSPADVPTVIPIEGIRSTTRGFECEPQGYETAYFDPDSPEVDLSLYPHYDSMGTYCSRE